MKKYIITIISLFFLLGCTNESKNKTEKYSNELIEFYNETKSLLENSTTRSNGSFEITEQELIAIGELVARFYDVNNVSDVIAVSGYYPEFTSDEELDMSDWDKYDLLNWVEQNGTEEYFDIIVGFIGGEKLTIKQIANNAKLLPNEKIALGIWVVINDTHNDSMIVEGPDASTVSKCLKIYESERSSCEAMIGAGYGGRTKVVTQKTLEMYDACITAAYQNFKKCSGIKTS